MVQASQLGNTYMWKIARAQPEKTPMAVCRGSKSEFMAEVSIFFYQGFGISVYRKLLQQSGLSEK